MTSLTDIISFICTEIERILGGAPEKPLGAETDMTTDISIDSVAIMDLVFSLEEQYDISVPLNALGEISTIGELAALVAELKGKS